MEKRETREYDKSKEIKKREDLTWINKQCISPLDPLHVFLSQNGKTQSSDAQFP